MEIFKIFLGASQVKFSIDFENNLYKAKVNGIVIAESTDYESVRARLLTDMPPTTNRELMH
jgi:hypothetical protein